MSNTILHVSETLFLNLVTILQKLLLSQFPENTKIPKVKQLMQAISNRAEFKS